MVRVLKVIILVLIATVWLGDSGAYASEKEDRTIRLNVLGDVEQPFDLVTTPVKKLEKVLLGEGRVVREVGFESTIEVIDLRGTHSGWDLTVMAEPLRDGDKELPRGTLSLAPPQGITPVGNQLEVPSVRMGAREIIDDGRVIVASAGVGSGTGVYEVMFGEDALEIVIDGGVGIEEGTYRTLLEWGIESKSDERYVIKTEVLEIDIEEGEDMGEQEGTEETGTEEGKGIEEDEDESGEVEQGEQIGDENKEVSEGEKVEINEDGEEVNEVGEESLPGTATVIYNILVVGVVLVVLGILVRKFRRKENQV